MKIEVASANRIYLHFLFERSPRQSTVRKAMKHFSEPQSFSHTEVEQPKQGKVWRTRFKEF
jgi:hypothetical protein